MSLLSNRQRGSQSGANVPFHIEQHGIDFIPPSDRWARPRDIAGLWAGASVNIEYFIYGALLMGFGFDFPTALSLILIGNLSFFLLGLASLQGQDTGTTSFIINRAPFGVRGSRIMAFFNWITLIGFETEGLILIVGAVIVLANISGVAVSGTSKVIIIIAAVGIQMLMPLFGHATMVRILKALIVPFILIFLALSLFLSGHGTLSIHGASFSNWQLYSAGLAFTIALSGLGWTECGNDYTRYLAQDSSRKSVVGWIFLATAVPQIILMTLGAVTFTFLSTSSVWNSANPFLAFENQNVIPTWFVVTLLLFAIVQLFAINSLDLYSSGVSLQALGLKLKRYQAVILDGMIAMVLTIWVEFQSSFATYMKEFVGIIIVWIAPWLAIFLVDWLLRRRRYSSAELQRSDPHTRYYGTNGFNLNGVIAFLAGVVLATMSFSKAPPPANFPFHWMTPISNHFGAFYCDGSSKAACGAAGWFGGADFSVFLGMGSAGLLYIVLESLTHSLKRQENALGHEDTLAAESTS